MNKKSCVVCRNFISIYKINRTFHGRLGIRILSSRAESISHSFASLTCERYFQHLKIKFVSLRSHEISSIYFSLKLTVDTSWPEESYGGVSTEKKLRAAMDRASLPTAPRAARGPDVDTTKIPEGPPYTAFLGNLSYDVDREDILEFFGNNKVLLNVMLYGGK